MSPKKISRPSLKNISKAQLFMILGFGLITVTAVIIVSVLTMHKTDEVLKNKVVSLTSSLNVQMKLNVESYLSRMETIATLAFGEKESYTYDATDPSNDEYEALNTEKKITERLYSLCIMENFVDYGIVYSNNRTVGKISNGTSTLFGDRIFAELSSMISRPRTNDGWATGYENNFKRIYYVKQVHENAVLVISFYATELDAVFDNPETLSDMDIRLVNQDNNLIYSKKPEEVGQPLPEDIRSRIAGKDSVSVLDNDYLVSVNRCGDWSVVCSIPTQIILNEKNDITKFTYVTAGIAAALAIFTALLLSYRIIKPIRNTVFSLDNKARIDLLTGILNKLSFEEYAGSCLANSLETERHALIILDIDNFKGVNDTLGHAYGDKVLKKTGEILRSTFSDDDYLGRIGGDEFCVLVNARFDTKEKFDAFLLEKCKALSSAYHNYYSGRDGSYKISASIGVALWPDNGRSFSELYAACDSALYRSKKSGRDTYTFYASDDPDKESEGGGNE
ncbi:MAG: GGDEF domain-containing protein [Ruminococcus sp.]|nr:GGDEF domain-containing protein [Ruminococcus sp.]